MTNLIIDTLLDVGWFLMLLAYIFLMLFAIGILIRTYKHIIYDIWRGVITAIYAVIRAFIIRLRRK